MFLTISTLLVCLVYITSTYISISTSDDNFIHYAMIGALGYSPFIVISMIGDNMLSKKY